MRRLPPAPRPDLHAMPHQAVPSFLGAPWSDPTRRYAFLGLGYDCSTTFRSGTRMAPHAIRDVSRMLADGAHPEFGVDPCALVSDWGNAAIPHVQHAAAMDAVEVAVTALLDAGRHPLLAGGEHSVSLGTLRALRQQYDEPLSCVIFDAHHDCWADHFGETMGHGTWVRNAIDEGLIEPARTVQFGIRSPSDPALARWLPDRDGLVLSARSAMKMAPALAAKIALHHVGDRPHPTYISFDVDALDPAFAPGTGTPEIGGLSTLWALECLEALRSLNLVGMDVVEVAPPYDHPSSITALAAATLLWTYVAMREAPASS